MKTQLDLLRKFDRDIEILKAKLKDVTGKRTALLDTILKGKRINLSGTQVLYPTRSPVLKGTRRELIKVIQPKALSFILKHKSLEGMKLTATKAVYEEINDASIFDLHYSAITWRLL